MNVFNDLIGSNIRLTISGLPIEMYGHVVDAGPDIVVIQSEKQFYYIPIIHIQNMTPAAEENINNQDSISYPPNNGKISFISTLTSAKEIYSEIYVTGLHSLHGYITGMTATASLSIRLFRVRFSFKPSILNIWSLISMMPFLIRCLWRNFRFHPLMLIRSYPSASSCKA